MNRTILAIALAWLVFRVLYGGLVVGNLILGPLYSLLGVLATKKRLEELGGLGLPSTLVDYRGEAVMAEAWRFFIFDAVLTAIFLGIASAVLVLVWRRRRNA